VDQGDPPFIAKIKQKTGYREPAKVEDKFVDTPNDGDEPVDKDDIRNLTEEERPAIVVLNPKTDVSGEQLDKEIEKMREEEDRKKIEEGRIIFRKPEKRTAVEKTEEKSADAKPTTTSEREESRKRSRPDSCNDPTAKLEDGRGGKKTDSRLLSFGEDEED